VTALSDTSTPMVRKADTDDALTPYKGIRVLDFAQGLAGPYTAAMLAAMGADVIKVEPPEGDWGRLMGEVNGENGSMSLPANWGKRALCVDARKEQGRAVLKRLVRRADVVIESFRPRVMAKLGLDYDTLAAEQPAMIYVSISGYGEQGPYAGRAGSDSIIQAVSGMAVMNQDTEGTPRRIGMLAVDMLTATYAAFSISSALYEQRVNGSGRRLQISLLHAAAAFQMTSILQNVLRQGKSRGNLATAPSGFFPTRTGMIAVTCLRDSMFASLCEALNRREWSNDPLFSSNAARLHNVDKLHEEISAVLATRDREYWIERLNRSGVLCGPVNEYADLVKDEQVRYVNLFKKVDTPEFGPLPLVGLPGGGLQPDQQLPAPALGNHTRAILVEAGYNEMQIAELLRDKTCYQADEA